MNLTIKKTRLAKAGLRQLLLVGLGASAALMSAASLAQANKLRPGESIVLDAKTGNYVITYCSDVVDEENLNSCPKLSKAYYQPTNRIKPVITPKLVLEANGVIDYSYTIANGAGAKQKIRSFIFPYVANIESSFDLMNAVGETEVRGENLLARAEAVKTALRTPKGWDKESMSTTPGELRLIWANYGFTGGQDIAAGASLNGFGFKSRSLPTVLNSQLMGQATLEYNGAVKDSGPSGEASIRYAKLTGDNTFAKVYTLAPGLIMPPDGSFVPANVIYSVRQQAQQFTKSKWLDATAAAKLETLLLAAQTEATNKNMVGAKANLANALNVFDGMAENGTVQGLSVTALKFNINYVISRLPAK